MARLKYGTKDIYTKQIEYYGEINSEGECVIQYMDVLVLSIINWENPDVFIRGIN